MRSTLSRRALVGTHIALLIHKAKEDRIPLAVTEHPMVEQGALVSYGADIRLLGVQAAKLVAKILKGAKPVGDARADARADCPWPST